MQTVDRVPAADLARVRTRFDAWRRQRAIGERIPEALWAAAVTLAETHGVSRVATTLRLDFYKLRQRHQHQQQHQQAAGEPRANSAAFLALPPVAAASNKLCRLDLGGRSGVSIRLELSGYHASEIAELARGLWGEG